MTYVIESFANFKTNLKCYSFLFGSPALSSWITIPPSHSLLRTGRHPLAPGLPPSQSICFWLQEKSVSHGTELKCASGHFLPLVPVLSFRPGPENTCKRFEDREACKSWTEVRVGEWSKGLGRCPGLAGHPCPGLWGQVGGVRTTELCFS